MPGRDADRDGERDKENRVVIETIDDIKFLLLMTLVVLGGCGLEFALR